MQREPQQALSAAGAQRLGEWLREQKALAPPAWGLPDVETLVRYCAGLLTAEQTEAVEGALTAYPSARQQWIQIHKILSALQQMPLESVTKIADGDDLRAQVAQLWLGIVTARTDAVVHLPNWWERLQNTMAEGASLPDEVLTLLGGIWHRWTTVLRVPSVALARAGDRARVLLAEGLPQDVQVTVDRFEVTQEGRLYLRLVVQQYDGFPSEQLSGVAITVYVDLGGESAPLVQDFIRGSTYEVSLPIPSFSVSPPAGEIPQGQLTIALGDLPPLTGGGRVNIPLEVEEGSPVWAQVQGLPECVNGQIRVRLFLSEEVRQSYAAHKLAMDLLLTPLAWQRLGEWQISAWQEGYRELTAFVPGIPDSTLPTTALLRLQLVRE